MPWDVQSEDTIPLRTRYSTFASASRSAQNRLNIARWLAPISDISRTYCVAPNVSPEAAARFESYRYTPANGRLETASGPTIRRLSPKPIRWRFASATETPSTPSTAEKTASAPTAAASAEFTTATAAFLSEATEPAATLPRQHREPAHFRRFQHIRYEYSSLISGRCP